MSARTFIPRKGLRNNHLQTVAGNFWRRPAFTLPYEREEIVVDEKDGSRIVALCHWQRHADGGLLHDHTVAVLVHGLEGSANSRYIHGLAARLWASGLHVVRMNQRNCGDTEALTPTLYHSGRSGDVGAVVDFVAQQAHAARVVLAGYSMGGNLVLKYAGEVGAKPPLAAVAAVSPAINLAVSSDALHSGLNRLYEEWFLIGLRKRYKRKAALFPDLYAPTMGSVRSVREFDNKVVARYCGFQDAADYYAQSAAANVVDRIQVPTLILHSADDPFIKILPQTEAQLHDNPHIDFVLTQHGGHCAFLSDTPGEDVHWAEKNAAEFLGAF